jgi:hypothetical protein
MVSAGVRILRGENYDISMHVQVEQHYDAKRLEIARLVAEGEGKGVQFDKAFPQIRETKVSQVNKLLKLGGRTAELVEKAKTGFSEERKFTYTKGAH